MHRLGLIYIISFEAILPDHVHASVAGFVHQASVQINKIFPRSLNLYSRTDQNTIPKPLGKIPLSNRGILKLQLAKIANNTCGRGQPPFTFEQFKITMKKQMIVKDTPNQTMS